MEVLDLKIENKWKILDSSINRYFFGAVLIKNEIMIFGGLDYKFKNLCSVLRLNLDSLDQEELEEYKMPECIWKFGILSA